MAPSARGAASASAPTVGDPAESVREAAPAGLATQPRIPLLPSVRTIALLASASAFFLASAAAGAVADLLILALAWLDGRRAALPRLVRRVPRAVLLGDEARVVLEVSNPSRRAVRILLTDDLDSRLERRPDRESPGPDDWERGVSVDLAERSSVRLTYRIRPRTRGFLRLGSVHMRSLGTLGLAWARTTVAMEDTLRVQPGAAGRSRSVHHAVRRHLREAGPRPVRRRGEGREFESLREYAKGDDPRTIDWKASARHRGFVVRSYQAERHQNVVLAIDAGRHMRERVIDRERADFALAAAMTLAGRAKRCGDRVGTLVFDDRIRHASPARRPDLGRMADMLAGVETRLVEPNYPLAAATLARTFRKRSLVVLFCDVIDEAVSRALVASLSRVGRAHLPLAVAIRNPALEAAAARTPATEAEAFRRAAAEEMSHARAVALERMRRSGVLVVDAAPGEAMSRTLDKYMEVKERGLL